MPFRKNNKGVCIKKQTLVILGASGFIGSHLITKSSGFFFIKAVSRNIAGTNHLSKEGITWYNVDLEKPKVLNKILSPGDIVINLLYISKRPEINIQVLNYVIESCKRVGIKKFIHCSTAAVVGECDTSVVNEETVCKPNTQYEKIKWRLEQIILAHKYSLFPFIILRPTVIIGKGSRNLKNLLNNLIYGNKLVNFIRSSLFYKRPLHLVSITDVVNALLFMAKKDNVSNGSIFNIAADDQAENKYHCVESIILRALNLKKQKIPAPPMPCFLISLLLKISGRSDSDVRRYYNCDKIYQYGLKSKTSIRQSLIEQLNDLEPRKKNILPFLFCK